MLRKIQFIFSHQGFVKYFFNTGWIMADKILKMLAGIVVGIWVARYLGPDRFGMLSYVIAFTGLFTPFRKLGLDGIITRDVAKNDNNNNELISTALFLKFVGGITLVALVSGYMFIFKENKIYLYIAFIISLSFVVRSFEVLEFYFRAKVQGKHISIANVSAVFIASLLKVLLILSGFGVVYFALANLVEALVAMLLLWATLRHSPNRLTFSDVRMAKAYELIRESWPLIFSGFFALVYLNIDQVMIEEMLGSNAVGQYSAAVKISSAWYFIPLTLGWSLQTAVVNARKMGIERYHERLQLLFTITAGLAYLTIFPVVFFSDQIIDVLFGQAYSLAGGVLALHMWASLFVFIGSARGLWVLNESYLKFALFSNVGAGIINVVLNYILLPIYGINAAALATVISYAFTYVLSGFMFAPARKIAVMQIKSLLLIDAFHQIRNLQRKEIYGA